MSDLDLWPEALRNQILGISWKPGDIAAFDADETLWDMDCGVGFLQWVCEQKKLPLFSGKTRYEIYQEARKRDEKEGLSRCADAFQGRSVSEVKEWVQEFSESFCHHKIYPAMKDLFSWLQSRGVSVYIVTASPRFTVLSGAKEIGIPEEQVIGINLKVFDGIYSDEIIGPVTYRQGKPQALLEVTKKAPRLCAGNGNNDRELLEVATDLTVAVNPSKNTRRDGSQSLYDASKANNWPILELRLDTAKLAS